MPTHKDFKRLVRRRMQKTGESYTAARAQLLESRSSAERAGHAGASPARSTSRAVRAAKPDYAKQAGLVSDAALKAATGCNWERWVKALDYVEAHTWPHRKIAQHVHENYKIPGWWAQTVTVGYERIRGLREIGQRRGGSFEASKSRTFAVPVRALYDAFAVPRQRAKWLPGVKLTVRKATPIKSLRMTWEDGTSVEVWLVPKGLDRSTAQIAHRKLADRAAVARAKAFWSERLEALDAVVSPEPSRAATRRRSRARAEAVHA